MTTGGTARDVIDTKRYLAGELSPTYTLTNNLSVGGYYLYSRGLDTHGAKNSSRRA